MRAYIPFYKNAADKDYLERRLSLLDDHVIIKDALSDEPFKMVVIKDRDGNVELHPQINEYQRIHKQTFSSARDGDRTKLGLSGYTFYLYD